MRALKSVFLFLLTALSTLIVCDLFLSYSGAISKSNSAYYEDIGKGYRPDYEYITFTEGFSITKINGLRYLGPGYPVKKNDSTVRIALLGDSYLSTHHVFDRDHVRSIIENTLIKNNLHAEVLNFGRTSFNLGNTYAYYKAFAQKFSPDYNLFFISHNNLTVESYDPLFIKTIVKNRELKINIGKNSYTGTSKFMHFLIQESAFFSMINSAKTKIKINGLFLTLVDKNRQFEEEKYSSKDFKLTPGVIKILQSLDEEKNILVWREKNNPPLALLAWIKTSNIRMIDLSPLIRHEIANGRDPNYWKVINQRGHWNQYGNKIAGEAVAKELTAIIRSEKKRN